MYLFIFILILFFIDSCLAILYVYNINCLKTKSTYLGEDTPPDTTKFKDDSETTLKKEGVVKVAS